TLRTDPARVGRESGAALDQSDPADDGRPRTSVAALHGRLRARFPDGPDRRQPDPCGANGRPWQQRHALYAGRQFRTSVLLRRVPVVTACPRRGDRGVGGERSPPVARDSAPQQPNGNQNMVRIPSTTYPAVSTSGMSGHLSNTVQGCDKPSSTTSPTSRTSSVTSQNPW